MTLRCMDALKTQMLHLIQAMGFRQMMVAVTLFALTCLIWLVLSLPGKKRWKIPVALAGAAGILSLALPWMRHTFTTWPAALLFPLVCCTAMILPITALQSIRTALLAPALILAPLWRTPLHTLLSRKLSLGVLLLGAATGLIAFYNAVKIPDVRETAVPIQNLPAELEDFRIVQLTDLHLGTIFTAPWLESVVEKVNALDADVIVLSGDLGESAPGLISDVLAPLEKLHARDGVFFTLGNHEMYQGREEWLRFYDTHGYRLLCDSHALIRRGNAALALGGADMRFHGSKELSNIFDGVPDGAVRILISHVPDRPEEAEALGVALQLSGHTHGGLMPGVKQLVAGSNGGFVSGLYNVGNMNLYVSNGTGLWSFVAARLFTPSEIACLRLVRAQ